MKKKKEWSKFEQLQEKVLFEFLKMIKLLSNSFPDKKLIIRPHPLERMDIYQEEFKSFNNIEVIRKGSVREWIVNAEAVIHYDCTTGIESLIAGKNVISFCPFYDENLVASLPIEISTKFTKIDDLIKFIKDDYKNINLTETREKKLLKLENYLANVTKNATTEIVKHTEELSKNFITFKSSYLKRLYYLGMFKLNKFFLISKALFQKGYTKNATARQKSKFSKLDENEIQERLAIWYNQLLIKDKFKVNKVDNNIFLIDK